MKEIDFIPTCLIMLKCLNLPNRILFHYAFPIHRDMTYLVQSPFNSMYYLYQEYDKFINANFSMHTFHLLLILFYFYAVQMKHFVPNLCKLFYAYITSSLKYLLLQCNTEIQNTVYNNKANFSMHESWPVCRIFYFHLTLQYKVVWKFF